MADVFQADYYNDITDVMHGLDQLEKDLAGEGLHSLRNFNKAYFIITKNVKNCLDQGGFEYPDFLRCFDIKFVYYYVHALRNYLDNRPNPPAWRKAFDSARDTSSSSLTYMALGVNAHVNNDIPQVLKDCNATDLYFNDFLKVNEIIADSIDEVIESLHEDKSLLSPKRTPFKPVYKVGMNHWIKMWRSNAWQNFERLYHAKMTVKEIEREAEKRANGLLKAPI